MYSGVAIISIANAGDGQRAIVTVSGAPSGPLVFWVSRTPYTSQGVSAPYTGSGPYYVTLGHQGIWYVWAKDNNGYSSLPVAIRLGVTQNSDLVECGNAVAGILLANKIGIEAALGLWYPGVELKQVVFGTPYDIAAFPSILVNRPRVQSQYVGTSYLREYTYLLDVTCMVVHSDEHTLLPYITEMLKAVEEILIQPANETIFLPNGQEVNFCQVNEGQGEEMSLDDMGFGAVGTLNWSGVSVKADSGH